MNTDMETAAICTTYLCTKCGRYTGIVTQIQKRLVDEPSPLVVLCTDQTCKAVRKYLG